MRPPMRGHLARAKFEVAFLFSSRSKTTRQSKLMDRQGRRLTPPLGNPRLQPESNTPLTFHAEPLGPGLASRQYALLVFKLRSRA